jgi:hypothetical protein
MLRFIIALLLGAAVLLGSAELAGRAVDHALVTLEPARGPARWTVNFTP